MTPPNHWEKRMTRFLSKNEVKQLTLYSHTHRARLTAAGKFPMPCKLGNGPRARVGYLESEIMEWIERRVQTRDKPDSSQ